MREIKRHKPKKRHPKPGGYGYYDYGIFKGITEGFLGPLAATADTERFGKWEKELQDALEELEKRYKGKKMSKEAYKKKRAAIKKELNALYRKAKKQTRDWETINKLVDDLKGLETRYKDEHMGKKECDKRKKDINEKLKKAKELLEKSRERFDKFTHVEIKY